MLHSLKKTIVLQDTTELKRLLQGSLVILGYWDSYMILGSVVNMLSIALTSRSSHASARLYPA